MAILKRIGPIMTITVNIQLHSGETVHTLTLADGTTKGEAWDAAQRYNENFGQGHFMNDNPLDGLTLAFRDSKELEPRSYKIVVSELGSKRYLAQMRQHRRITKANSVFFDNKSDKVRISEFGRPKTSLGFVLDSDSRPGAFLTEATRRSVRFSPSLDLPVQTFLVGTRVEGNYRGSGHWYPGVVLAVHENGTVNLSYDDGDKEYLVPTSLVRLENVSLGAVATPPVVAGLTVGARINANYRNLGRWFPGVVSGMHDDGSVDLNYDNNKKEIHVPASQVCLEEAFVVGTRIEANYLGLGAWYSGSITHVHADGSGDIDNDDGDRETHVAASLIRRYVGRRRR